MVGVGYAGAASRVEVLVLRRFSHIAAAWSAAAAAAGRVVGPQSTFATAVAPWLLSLYPDVTTLHHRLITNYLTTSDCLPTLTNQTEKTIFGIHITY